MRLRLKYTFRCFAAFVQDDNDVQYLLDNMPISMHKVSKFATSNVLHNYYVCYIIVIYQIYQLKYLQEEYLKQKCLYLDNRKEYCIYSFKKK